MALTSSDVYSPQNAGLATVLGSGLGPLRIMQQQASQAARERQAAARLRQQQEQADARNIVPLEANGWLPHNDELTAAVQAGYEKQKAIYADPSKSMFQKRAEAQQIATDLKQKADRSNELNARYKQTIGLASDPRYDKAALEKAAYGSFYQTDPETGQRSAIPLGKYDPSTLDATAVNPATFNRDKVLQTFIKAEADKESVRLGKAAPSGGYGVNRQASSDIFDVNPDGTLAINADGSYKIRDINALVQRAHADPFMSAILRGNAAKAQQEAGAGAMANYGQLTPEQNAELNGLQRTAPAERADLATMLAGYGKTKASSVQSYRAAPRPAAGAKPKGLPITAAPTEGDYQVGGEVPVTSGQDANFVGYNAYAPGANPTGADARAGQTQKGFVSGYSVVAPLDQSSGGAIKRFNLGTTGTGFTRTFAPDEKGQYGWRVNVDKATVGELGDAISLPVRPDGTPITPKDKAEYEKAVRDPRNHLQSFVQVLTPKDKNFSAKYDIRLGQLKKERDRLIQVGDEEAKRTTDATLADKAREEATGETVIQYVPNTGQDARTLDRLTKDFGGKNAGNYRAHREGITSHQQRIRSTQPAVKANPLGFTPKAAPAKPKTVGKNNALGF